jgi:hypothetical protein
MMERWECRTCAGNMDEAILWDGDTANKLLIPMEACYQAALMLITEMGPNNPFLNLAEAVKAVQEVKREIMV